MKTELKTRTRILTGAAVATLMATTAMASDAVTDTSRAAEDQGAIQTMGDAQDGTKATGGTVRSPEDGAIADAKSAADTAEGMSEDVSNVTEGTVTSPVQDNVSDTSRAAADVADERMAQLTVSEAIDKDVMSANGVTVGEIEGISVGEQSASAVIDHDGKMVSVPLSAIDITTNGNFELKGINDDAFMSMEAIDVAALRMVDGDVKIGDLY